MAPARRDLGKQYAKHSNNYECWNFTALNPGSADLYFTDLESNCKSVTPVTINVVAVDSIQLNGKDTICIGQTTHFTSSPTYGFWVTDDPVVATIDSQGVVTGLSEGICRIYKFSHISGCTSTASQYWFCQKINVIKIPFLSFKSLPILMLTTTICIHRAQIFVAQYRHLY